jgi:hypothetical protein
MMTWQERADAFNEWYKCHKEKLAYLESTAAAFSWLSEMYCKAHDLGIKIDDNCKPIPPETLELMRK